MDAINGAIVAPTLQGSVQVIRTLRVPQDVPNISHWRATQGQADTKATKRHQQHCCRLRYPAHAPCPELKSALCRSTDCETANVKSLARDRKGAPHDAQHHVIQYAIWKPRTFERAGDEALTGESADSSAITVSRRNGARTSSPAKRRALSRRRSGTTSRVFPAPRSSSAVWTRNRAVRSRGQPPLPFTDQNRATALRPSSSAVSTVLRAIAK